MNKKIYFSVFVVNGKEILYNISMLARLDRLFMFYTVVLEGSISKAAKKLKRTQPSVSIVIANLEETLKCKLLKRGKKGISLTREGRILFDALAESFEDIAAAMSKIDDLTNYRKLVLNFYTEDSISSEFLINILTKIKQEFPKSNIRHQITNSKAIHEAIHEHRIDFAIVTSPITDVNDFDVYPLTSFHQNLVFHQDLNIKSVDEILKYPIACDKNSQQFLLQLLNNYKLKTIIDFQLETKEQVLELVKNKVAVGFMETSNLPSELKIFKINKHPRHICLISNKFVSDVRLQQIINFLTKKD